MMNSMGKQVISSSNIKCRIPSSLNFLNDTNELNRCLYQSFNKKTFLNAQFCKCDLHKFNLDDAFNSFNDGQPKLSILITCNLCKHKILFNHLILSSPFT